MAPLISLAVVAAAAVQVKVLAGAGLVEVRVVTRAAELAVAPGLLAVLGWEELAEQTQMSRLI
jgi:hypothetical protein